VAAQFSKLLSGPAKNLSSHATKSEVSFSARADGVCTVARGELAGDGGVESGAADWLANAARSTDNSLEKK